MSNPIEKKFLFFTAQWHSHLSRLLISNCKIKLKTHKKHSNSKDRDRTRLPSYLEDFSHLSLLRKGAVVLYGQDDGHIRIDKRRPVNCFHNILKDHGREDEKEEIVDKSTASQICNNKTQTALGNSFKLDAAVGPKSDYIK